MLLIAILTFARVVPAQVPLVVLTLVVTAIGALSLLLFFRPSSVIRMGKRYFYLLVLTCILLAVGWLIGVLM
jgi:hypothetical protein